MFRYIILISIIYLLYLPLSAQDKGGIPAAQKSFGDGVTIVDNDDYSFSLSSNFQPRMTINQTLNEDLYPEFAALIRRLRLRFSGFILDKNLTYLIHLAFSQRDMESTGRPDDYPGVIFDAYINYQFAPKTSLYFGQMKLPGNLSRLMSFTGLNFTERSAAESEFTPYRDIGFQIHNEFGIGNYHQRQAFAITNGEGKNREAIGDGLCYSGRVEVLPLGLFAEKGEYYEPDLAREESPKLAVGAAYLYNDNARRTASTLGKTMPESADMQTMMLDLNFKWRGFNIFAEYFRRTSDKNVIIETDPLNIYYIRAGEGYSVQCGYVTRGGWGFALRYADVLPESDGLMTFHPEKNLTLGFAKYFRGNDLKLQADVNYLRREVLNSWIYENVRFVMQIVFII